MKLYKVRKDDVSSPNKHRLFIQCIEPGVNFAMRLKVYGKEVFIKFEGSRQNFGLHNEKYKKGVLYIYRFICSYSTPFVVRECIYIWKFRMIDFLISTQ